jgi:hypothetical protein
MAAVRVLRVRRDGDLTSVELATAEGRWSVGVRTTMGEDVKLTCTAQRLNPNPHHEVVEVRQH